MCRSFAYRFCRVTITHQASATVAGPSPSQALVAKLRLEVALLRAQLQQYEGCVDSPSTSVTFDKLDQPDTSQDRIASRSTFSSFFKIIL